ncbi:hypothetical protein AVEN_172118-1 [Araneus ventricosus]|uniref:Uncharacterized protein n=1 Tax=Araneus ventricosus TaxID=182803 RepID=A0A4Y2AKC3_ARAVE|nr:hypothetical protein AVEN_172118-1 [Araneus ventricosus]
MHYLTSWQKNRVHVLNLFPLSNWAHVSMQIYNCTKRSRGGLMVRNEPRNRIPPKIRRVLGLLQVESYVGGQTSSRRCGAEVWRRGASSGVVLVI